MKQYLLIISVLFTTNLAFGNCNTQRIKDNFFHMFKIHGQLSDWVGVGSGKGFRKDKAFAIYVAQERDLESSSIEFRGTNIPLKGASICIDPEKAGRYLLQHPDYSGTLSVQRRGVNVDDSIIKIKRAGGIFRTYIRPLAAIK